MISAYGKIYNLGHEAVRDLFNGPVLIEEKVDGSQFSFGVDMDGELCCRSKNCEINVDDPTGLFDLAVTQVRRVRELLPRGYTFRAEYLKKPAHNHLNYMRVPLNNLALFDVDTGDQSYLPHASKTEWAKALDFDVVPVIFEGKISSEDDLKDAIKRRSYLGGADVEGVVIKNYSLFGRDGKTLMGKYVSPAFRETQKVSWKAANPGGAEIREVISEKLRTDRRWEKAVERMRDDGVLENSPRDIGILIRYVRQDLTDECVPFIKDLLYDWAKDNVMRGAIRGLPEWYKQRLIDQQFGGAGASDGV
jgi:hypothetical protein